jgi:uncharacterized repeat protein (TIGR02543 family)
MVRISNPLIKIGKVCLTAVAVTALLMTCSKSPTGFKEPITPQGVTLTTTRSSSIATILRVPDKAAYAAGDSVLVIVTTNSGYTFTGWSGDTVTSADTLVIVMNTNKTIFANFKSSLGRTIFSVVTSATNGSIILSPEGGVYDSGTTVTTGVVAAYGYVFAGWVSDLSDGTSPDTLVVSRNISLKAIFAVDPRAKFYSIQILPAPSHGAITIQPQGVSIANGYKYEPSTCVTVTATPDSSYEFTAWGGDFSNEVDPLVSRCLDTNLVITATFTKAPPLPDLTGTWAFSGGQYISGSIYGTLTFDSQSDTLVLKGDSTYVSMVQRSSSINGSYFGGIGSGTWSATKTGISFSYPLAQGFEYTLSGGSLILDNGEMTLYASHIH